MSMFSCVLLVGVTEARLEQWFHYLKKHEHVQQCGGAGGTVHHKECPYGILSPRFVAGPAQQPLK
jgi:hypothetical protein